MASRVLYKLRQLGVPLEGDSGSVGICTASVTIDCASADCLRDRGAVERLRSGLLTGMKTTVSSTYDAWLEGFRTNTLASLLPSLMREMSTAQTGGEHALVHTIATAVLAIDPLNVDATTALAAALALSGQKSAAIRVLDQYSAEMGDQIPRINLAMPANLRRRISERIKDVDNAPILGRSMELRWMLQQHAQTTSGRSTISYLWGEAGIGKSRLLDEFLIQLSLKEAVIERYSCQPHDAGRPLGTITDLVPRLLNARGALGISPTSLAFLRTVTGDLLDSTRASADLSPAALSRHIRNAVADLVECISAEVPLVIAIEDAQWLDDASYGMLTDVIGSAKSRTHGVVTSRNAPSRTSVRSADRLFARKLDPLPLEAASALLDSVSGGLAFDSDTREQCLALAAGNPLFIRTVAEHLRLQGTVPPSDTRVGDLLRQRLRLLDPITLLLIRCIAILGKHASPDRLRACSGISFDRELSSIQEAAELHLLSVADGAVTCAHDVITSVVLNDCPEAVRVTICERAGTLLERDGETNHNASLLWSCARFWEQAGNKQRAVRAFERCAEFALTIGQPTFAQTALSSALHLVDRSERARVLDRAIVVAELAHDYPNVLTLIRDYRAVMSSAGLTPPPHHHSELAEVNAIRRAGGAVWHFQDLLRRCALDSEADYHHRIRAARLFLIIAELLLTSRPAEELFQSIQAAGLANSDDRAWHELSMIFHGAFGDNELAVRHAETLRMALSHDDPAQAPLYLNIGAYLFRAGHVDAARDSLLAAVQLHERLGLPHMLGQAIALLTTTYFLAGDWDTALVWHLKGEALLRSADVGHASIQICNRIDFALRDSDWASANENLTLVKSNGEATAPAHARTIAGYELIIAGLRGASEHGASHLDDLRTLDESGRRGSEHHVFAIGIAIAFDARGRCDEALARWQDYLRNWRRERFPLRPYCQAVVRNDKLLQGMLAEIQLADAEARVTTASFGR